jgi:hypothetical protein
MERRMTLVAAASPLTSTFQVTARTAARCPRHSAIGAADENDLSKLATFGITVRTEEGCIKYTALATSSSGAYAAAADFHGDAPCGITVTPA